MHTHARALTHNTHAHTPTQSCRTRRARARGAHLQVVMRSGADDGVVVPPPLRHPARLQVGGRAPRTQRAAARAWCMVYNACCTVSVAWRMLYVVRCTWYSECCLLHVACSSRCVPAPHTCARARTHMNTCGSCARTPAPPSAFCTRSHPRSDHALARKRARAALAWRRARCGEHAHALLVRRGGTLVLSECVRDAPLRRPFPPPSASPIQPNAQPTQPTRAAPLRACVRACALETARYGPRAASLPPIRASPTRAATLGGRRRTQRQHAAAQAGAATTCGSASAG